MKQGELQVKKRHTMMIASMICLISLLPLLLGGCDGNGNSGLPVIGEVTRDFSFVNQENKVVTPETLADRIYVTDFFFTSCPSICPIMKRQMTRVYDVFKEQQDDFMLLSHTIDPEHDTVQVLKNYSDGLEVDPSLWLMVTGDQDEIFAMAKHYMLGAMKNDDVPGGYIHSGSFVLVDRKKRIRGYYNGTDPEKVDLMITDIKRLLDE